MQKSKITLEKRENNRKIRKRKKFGTWNYITKATEKC